MTYAFVPRRPVKSFQDLEVYQKLLAVSVAIAKRITLPHAPLPKLSEVDNKSLPKTPPPIGGVDLTEIMVKTALDLPLKIASAHSLRFSDQLKAINTLEETMLGCNLLIVYLEQYRDIENGNTGTGTIEAEFFEENIKILLATRFKVMHLQMSWKKFMKEV